MVATSAGESAGKRDRRCALFSLVAEFCGDVIVPGRFPSPLGARILLRLSAMNSFLIFLSNNRMKIFTTVVLLFLEVKKTRLNVVASTCLNNASDVFPASVTY